MINYGDIKAAIAAKIKEIYPKIPVYGIEMTEGFKTPCFFVSMNIYAMDGGYNSVQKTLYAEIAYAQKTGGTADAQKLEAEAYDFFQNIEKAFYPKLQVKDRFLNTDNFNLNFEGDHNNVPYVEFESTFFDVIEHQESAELMQEVTIKEET